MSVWPRDGLPPAELLQKLAEPLLAAAESARLGVSVSVVDGPSVRRIYVSEIAAQIFGVPAEEILGTSTFATFSPAERERLVGINRRWLNGDPVPDFLESKIARRDGSEIPVEVAYTMVNVDGRVLCVTLLRDISERKRGEEKLMKSERLFRELIEAAPEAVCVTRRNNIAYVNPRYLHLLGYERFEEIANRDPVDLIHPEDRWQLEERRLQIAESGKNALPREYRLMRRDGRAVTVECSSIAIDFEGQPALLTYLRDVTERRETQARLIQTDRMATIGTLSAGVAHELNNPLAYLILNIDILDREAADMVPDPAHCERLRARLATVREGAERVATIVRDLRSFCRPNAPTLAPVDLRHVLESAINMAMNELKDRAKVVREFSPVPHVLADGARLGQVFLNLLLNAAQALPDGRPHENEVRIVLRLDGADRFRIEVSDTGHGIPPDILDRIFEPFFTTKPVGVGTGLGLSICQSIVHGMNGELSVASDLGRGSTFRVTLPLTTVDDAHEPPPSQGRNGTRSTKERARILVIDDEAAIGSALSKVLEEEHEVTSVTTGEQALALLGSGASFDVILCDVLMPGTSGIEFYRQLSNARPELARRVIFMTGASAMPRVAEFFNTVTNMRIDKPVDIPQLRQLIGDVTRARLS